MANTTQILKLSCTHDYFSGRISGITLKPTRATQRWADTHGVLMRMSPDEIVLYGPEETETPGDEEELLTFLLLVNDTQFYNYTQLPPVSTKDRLCYVPFTDGRRKTSRTIDETNFFDRIQGIAVKENSNSEKPLQIKNQLGEEVISLSWNGRTSLLPFMNDLPPGKYDWTYGEEEGYFFVVPGSTGRVFGLLEIRRESLKDAEIALHFEARTSIWEYYIIDKKEAGNGYEIIDEKGDHVFSFGTRTSVLGGRSAVKIASEAPIAFKQYPEVEFKLVTHVNSGGMKQPWNGTMALPAGKSGQLQLSGAKETEYRTPIYIYI